MVYYQCITTDDPVSPDSIANLQLSVKDDSTSGNPDNANYTYISYRENAEVPMTSNKAYVQHVQTSSAGSNKQASKPVDNNNDNKISMATNVCYGKNRHDVTKKFQNNQTEKSEESDYLSVIP